MVVSGLPLWLRSKESACNAADAGGTGSTPEWPPVEKEVAAHSSILAWRIPWAEEPGGIQAIGLQRVGP